MYHAGYFNGETQKNISVAIEDNDIPAPAFLGGLLEGVVHATPGFLEGVVHATPVTVLSGTHPQVVDLK